MSHSSFSTVLCIYSGLTSKYPLTTSGGRSMEEQSVCTGKYDRERFHEANEEGASQLALA